MLDTISPDLLRDLQQRHAEPQRFYHDWSHVEALLGHFRRIEELVHDREGVLHAILFHDAIYDPRAKDNERRSARAAVFQRVGVRTFRTARAGEYRPVAVRPRARELT